jgi:rieske iron-sulfur protein
MSNQSVPRRTALGFGASALISTAPIQPASAAPTDPAALPPQTGDSLVFAAEAAAGGIIAPADLAVGRKPILAWAMEPGSRIVRNRFRTGQVLLMRLDAADLSEAEVKFAADDIVAFSAICTHAGCLVSGWRPQEARLFCPCHGWVYDPASGARVVGGPAPRPLPALPLRIESDGLMVAAPFTARIGGYTGRTD